MGRVLLVGASAEASARVRALLGHVVRVVAVGSPDDPRAHDEPARGFSCVLVDAAVDPAACATLAARARPVANPAPIAVLGAPVRRDALLAFVARALVLEVVPDARVSGLVAERARTHRLSAREIELLVHALAGTRRDEILRRNAVRACTLHSQVRTLLRKLDAPSLDALALALLREAVGLGSDASSR